MFSVLMSIYGKEKALYFNRAMKSIWDEQTIKPSEIVLVQDGNLTDELYEAINKWQEKLGNTFKIIPLKENVGLGDALNIGIAQCSYDLIARMDTDDISLPNRFEKQLKIFSEKDIDVCSAWISEFSNDESNIESYRKIPENHKEIVVYAKTRCPVNHIPIMYKKIAVQKAGGYQRMMWLEDYYLWVRMIISGAKFYNIQEPLANIRAGEEQLMRRSGLKYAFSEIRLQKFFLDIGFINFFQFLKNISIRFILRIMPKVIIKVIYMQLRGK